MFSISHIPHLCFSESIVPTRAQTANPQSQISNLESEIATCPATQDPRISANFLPVYAHLMRKK
jgi:hypothetical protein